MPVYPEQPFEERGLPARGRARGSPAGGAHRARFHPEFKGNPETMSPRYRSGANSAGTIVAVVADIMALILGLWILMYLLDANPGNSFVQFIHDAARWLAGWSHDLFTFDEAWARVVCGYGLAAVVYLLIGHAIANRAHRH